MQKKTVYVSDDGTTFNTEEECLEYENKNSEQLADLRAVSWLKNQHEKVTKEIRQLKQKTWYDNHEVESAFADTATRLPRIEAIVAHTRKRFLEELNTRGRVTTLMQAGVIAKVAADYHQALCRRRELQVRLRDLRESQKNIVESLSRLEWKLKSEKFCHLADS
jgi:hypothetical protein